MEHRKQEIASERILFFSDAIVAVPAFQDQQKATKGDSDQ